MPNKELRINDTRVYSSNLRTSFFNNGRMTQECPRLISCLTLILEYLITWWLYIHFGRLLVNFLMFRKVLLVFGDFNSNWKALEFK